MRDASKEKCLMDREEFLTSVGVICPQCKEVINVPIKVWIQDAEFAHLGMAQLCTEPMIDDLWVHMFNHQLDTDIID